MKKTYIWISVLLFILSCICLFIWFTNKDFSIPDSKVELEKELNIFVSENESDITELKMKKLEKVKDSNTWIALLSSDVDLNEKIRYAHLEKNWRKHYKIIAVGSIPNISYIDIQTNAGLFGVLIGINKSLSIKNIDIRTMGETQLESTFDVGGEKYFIKYISITNGIQSTSPAEFILYDNDNQVIPND